MLLSFNYIICLCLRWVYFYFRFLLPAFASLKPIEKRNITKKTFTHIHAQQTYITVDAAPARAESARASRSLITGFSLHSFFLVFVLFERHQCTQDSYFWAHMCCYKLPFTIDRARFRLYLHFASISPQRQSLTQFPTTHIVWQLLGLRINWHGATIDWEIFRVLLIFTYSVFQYCGQFANHHCQHTFRTFTFLRAAIEPYVVRVSSTDDLLLEKRC